MPGGATTKSLHGGDRVPRFVRVEPPPGLEACASACGGSPRPALRPAAMSGHEPGLRPTRTHCHFTCLACRPPRAERSWGSPKTIPLLHSSTFPPFPIPHSPFPHFKTVLILMKRTKSQRAAKNFSCAAKAAFVSVGAAKTRSVARGAAVLAKAGRTEWN